MLITNGSFAFEDRAHLSLAPQRPKKPLELVRLWQSDERRQNKATPLSQFVAATLRWLKQHASESDCVFSYADPAQTNPAGQPHNGGIYRAANFVYAGQARATDCWRTPAGKVVSAAKAFRRFKTVPPVRVVAGLPGLYQVIDGVHRAAAANPQAYFNCGHREQV